MAVGIDDFGASFIKYLPGVVKTLNATTAARLIPTGKVKWQGERIQKTVHVKRNTGIANAVDGGAIPVAGKQTYVPSYAYRKFIVGSVKVTDGILLNAETTENAAVSVTTSELDGLYEQIKVFENWQWTRDGSGLVANAGTDITASSAGDTFTVDDARMLWDDQDYEIRTGGTATISVPSFRVRSVARTPTAAGEFTVTCEGGVSGTAGDDIYWKTGNLSSYGRALTGLDKLIDNASTTFQGISTTTYPRYTSPVLSNSGTARPITPRLFRQMLATLKQESGVDMNPEFTVLTTVWDALNVEELFEGQQRLTATDRIAGLDLPVFQSMFGKFSLLTDKDAPYGKMFFIKRDQISYVFQKELGWRGGDKNIFMRSDDNLSWTATALSVGELFIEQRNQCGKITDLKVDVKTAY